MKNTRFCARWSLRSPLPAFALSLAFLAPAAGAMANAGGDENETLIDLIIDWIEEFFDPEEPVETLPSEEGSW